MKSGLRGPVPAAKAGGAPSPRKGRSEWKDEHADDVADYNIPETQTIVPPDQLKLTEKELDDDITRVLTASNPQACSNVVQYSFVEREFKPVPVAAAEHTVFHFRMTGGMMHVESAEAAAQRAHERSYHAALDEKRRERQRAAQEAAMVANAGGMLPVAAYETGAGGDHSAGDAADLQRNQFNYTERACQTFVPPLRSRNVSTHPPATSSAEGSTNAWLMMDAYNAEFERLSAAAAGSDTPKAASSATTTTAALSGGAAAGVASESLGAATGGHLSDPIHGARMGHALRLMERVLAQNADDEVFADFRYWEDASDRLRGVTGTCLPLWKFESEGLRTKRRMVTALTWNRAYPDLFAVGYGSYDFMKQGSGAVGVYSLKNTGRPEYAFVVDAGVMSLDFHPSHPALLAVGAYDGTVRVFDVRRKESKAVFVSDVKSGKHSDPVWEVKWAPVGAAGGGGGDLCFYSVSGDGRVASWTLAKNELRMEVIVSLRAGRGGSGGKAPWSDAAASATSTPGGGDSPMTPSGDAAAAAATLTASVTTTTTSASAAVGRPRGSGGPTAPTVSLQSLESTTTVSVSISGGGGRDSSGAAGAVNGGGLSGGTCLAFHPVNERIFLVGTEDGFIHKCSLDYSGAYLASFPGHKMAVYAVRWNAFHPRVFLSSSADWSIKLWDDSFTSGPIMSWDTGFPVGDVAWAPYSSTVFSAVTDEGRVQVWDLHVDKHANLCDQKVVKKAKCTHVAFNPRLPIILTSESAGGVMSLKLSPNLRRITPILVPVAKKGEPAPPPPASREEVEIRKLDKLLELSDAKICIVTPIPGQEKPRGAKCVKVATGEEDVEA